MNILAIECSGAVLTLFLRKDKKNWSLSIDEGFHHGENLMPAVVSLSEMAHCDPQSLDLVVCSAGPGSFTGLRIGMATAKGIAHGASCPFKAVPTLDFLAFGREHWPGLVIPLINARKNRVYAAAFRHGSRICADTDSALLDFITSLPATESLLITGPGAPLATGLAHVIIDPLYAMGHGSALIHTAIDLLTQEGPDSIDRGPLYLRISEAEENLKKRKERKANKDQ